MSIAWALLEITSAVLRGACLQVMSEGGEDRDNGI